MGAARASEVKLYHKNPRQITHQQYTDLEAWLDELGDLSGIVHDLNSDEIPAGNQRSRIFGIIKDEGNIVITETLDKPTRQGTVARGYIEWHGERYSYRQVKWTPEQCEKANIIANRGGGGWDYDILANQFEFNNLLEWGFSTEALLGAGFSFVDEPPPDPGAQIGKAEELQQKWQVQTGDLWEVGRHRLLCGNATNSESVHRLMGGDRALLMATDPPYGDAWVQKARDMHSLGYGHSRAVTRSAIEADDLSDDEFTAFLNEWLSVAVAEALVAPASVYVWHRARRTQFELALVNNGFHVHQPVIWLKPSFVIGRLNYHPRCEWALHGWLTGNGRGIFLGKRNQTDIWEVERESGWGHPTQKPLELYEKPMRNHLKAGEIVYDPFVGSGTAIAAAERQDFLCYALELKAEYCAVTLERLAGMGLEPRRV